MKPLTITDADAVVLVLQDEIRRSADARYDHRLHGLLLVAQGMSCREAAKLLGDSPRTVAYWVQRFEADGLAGLCEEERSGRPSRLGKRELAAIEKALRASPTDAGMTGGVWDGKTLSAFIEMRWKKTLGVRQCQRLFRDLGFRLRKPRGTIAKGDPERQARVKKTPPDGAG